jgi:hypothetical protein
VHQLVQDIFIDASWRPGCAWRSIGGRARVSRPLNDPYEYFPDGDLRQLCGDLRDVPDDAILCCKVSPLMTEAMTNELHTWYPDSVNCNNKCNDLWVQFQRVSRYREKH